MFYIKIILIYCSFLVNWYLVDWINLKALTDFFATQLLSRADASIHFTMSDDYKNVQIDRPKIHPKKTKYAVRRGRSIEILYSVGT